VFVTSRHNLIEQGFQRLKDNGDITRRDSHCLVRARRRDTANAALRPG
jgi:hypothetical protein